QRHGGTEVRNARCQTPNASHAAGTAAARARRTAETQAVQRTPACVSVVLRARAGRPAPPADVRRVQLRVSVSPWFVFFVRLRDLRAFVVRASNAAEVTPRT